MEEIAKISKRLSALEDKLTQKSLHSSPILNLSNRKLIQELIDLL